jgi:TAG lipase/steryl ester hydrolase/phospholipase A2/LPA acyltransferase
MIDLFALSTLRVGSFFHKIFCHTSTSSQETNLRRQLREATSGDEWKDTALELDDVTGAAEWRRSDEDLPTAHLLRKTLQELQGHREKNDVNQLMYLLPGLVKRDHLGIDERILHTTALTGTKQLVESYLAEVEACLSFLCEHDTLSLSEKRKFFRKIDQCMGHTAVCLSGGGSIAMYHAGVIRSLIENGLYKHIDVFSGTSGGSIIAGMLACQTEEELLESVLVREVSTDFRGDGSQKKRDIAWFPPLHRQAYHFLRKGVLMDNKDFERCTRFYYGDMTFEEAYQRTRKHVNITVSASRTSGHGKGPQRLLLNHINTPHVLVASAVEASCCLPGIMEPTKLMVKGSNGSVTPFEVDGVEWIDGSVQADVPFKRMGALFNISNFVVSQTNFHVQPFISESKSQGAGSGRNNMATSKVYGKVFKMIDQDIRSRAQKLAQIGLFPRFFGHDVSAVFKQKYHGNVTIVPQMSMTQSMGLHAIVNPTVEAMDRYIMGGKKAVW